MFRFISSLLLCLPVSYFSILVFFLSIFLSPHFTCLLYFSVKENHKVINWLKSDGSTINVLTWTWQKKEAFHLKWTHCYDVELFFAILSVKNVKMFVSAFKSKTNCSRVCQLMTSHSKAKKKCDDNIALPQKNVTKNV